jgi:hypothetical protein
MVKCFLFCTIDYSFSWAFLGFGCPFLNARRLFEPCFGTIGSYDGLIISPAPLDECFWPEIDPLTFFAFSLPFD